MPPATGTAVTRVMSPSDARPSTNLGLILGFHGECPQCRLPGTEPVTCSACGAYGHATCIRAEICEGLPFCSQCLRDTILDFSVREDRRRREAWREYYFQQLHAWKQRALEAVGISSTVGLALGGTAAVAAGAAMGLAKGAVAAATGARASAQAALEAGPSAPMDPNDITSGSAIQDIPVPNADVAAAGAHPTALVGAVLCPG